MQSDAEILMEMQDTLDSLTDLCRALIDELSQYKAVYEEELRLESALSRNVWYF